MKESLDLIPEEAVLTSLSDDEFLDQVGEHLIEHSYFEIEPTKESLREHARGYLLRQYSRLKRHLCKDEIIKKTSVLPPSEAASVIMDVIKDAIGEDDTLLVLSFALVKYTALYVARVGLTRLCAGT